MVKVSSRILLLIFIYYCVYYIFTGIKNPVPALGDSWDYHIPISQSILNGTFVNPTFVPRPQIYYPGSAEAINSLLLFLHIPLTLSNILAIIVLAATLIRLGIAYGLDFDRALLFSMTFVNLNVIIRWMNAVSIDIWVAVFFSLILILLQNPQKTVKYFVKLGFVTGMLIGSKYTATALLIAPLILYYRKLSAHIKVRNIIALAIPFSLLGFFWYIRNYIILGNPFYPLCLFKLPCSEVFGGIRVYRILIDYPKEMFDAFFSEYKYFMFAPIIVLIALYKDKTNQQKVAGELSIIGFVNILFYLFYPSNDYLDIMISSQRYSYTAFITIILALFLIAKKFKREDLLSYVSVASAVTVLSMPYHPKIMLLSLPLGLLIIKCFDLFFGKKK